MSQMDKIQIDLHREDFFSRYSKKDLKKILSKILQHIDTENRPIVLQKLLITFLINRHNMFQLLGKNPLYKQFF